MEVQMNDVQNDSKQAEATMADAATGAVLGIVDAASHPVSTARREIRKLEDRGQPVNRKVTRQVERNLGEAVETTGEFLDGTIPEKFVLSGIRLVKNTARRRDLVGNVAYRTLVVLNGGLEMTLRTLNRLENASEPPTRPAKSRSTGTARPATRKRPTVTARATTKATTTRKRVTKAARSVRTTVRNTARKTA